MERKKKTVKRMRTKLNIKKDKMTRDKIVKQKSVRKII
jgi:hypothetical protein